MLQPCIFQEARVALGCASSNSYTLFCALWTSCILNISTLMHELIVKCWRWSYTSEVVGDGGLTVIFILWMSIPRNSMQIEILQTISNLKLIKVQEFKTKKTFTLNFPLQGLIYGACQCKMQTADWLRTIVFRVRKHRDYWCHLLICMVKTRVRSLCFILTVNLLN